MIHILSGKDINRFYYTNRQTIIIFHTSLRVLYVVHETFQHRSIIKHTVFYFVFKKDLYLYPQL